MIMLMVSWPMAFILAWNSRPRISSPRSSRLAPGLAFKGSDSYRTLVLPAGFCELEIGHETWGALSLGVEIVRYRDLGNGAFNYDYETDTIYPVVDQNGTEISWYLGAKAAGWKGLVSALALGAGLAIAISSSGGLGY